MLSSALSDAVQRLQPSATVAVTTRAGALRAAGRDVIGLGAGEPDFDTPDHIKHAAYDAIAEGKTKYTTPDGIIELKEAVCRKLARDNELDFTTSQVHVAPGGKAVVWNALLATLNPGDEVIIPVPYWVSYPEMTRLAGARSVPVASDPSSSWKLTPDALERAISPRTKWLILNSPCNPTGETYTRAELAALARVLLEHPWVWVLSDDIYEHLVYDGFDFSTIGQVEPRLVDRTLVVNGVSKAYSMTGWRIGYAAGPAELIRAMGKIASQTTSNPCSIAQWAAVAALDGSLDFLGPRLKVFAARRDLVTSAMNAIDGVSCRRPTGAFYVFADITPLIGRRSSESGALLDDVAFTTALLDEAGVAVVPGSAFGQPGAVRVSYATSTERLASAGQRIADFASRLR